MKLGNSNGNNKGKKYFIRANNRHKLVERGMEKAAALNRWFEENYESIKCELIQKNIYNCDAVNETYLRMCENLMYSNLEILDYRSYFMRSFYTNYMQATIHDRRYCTIVSGYDPADEDGVYDAGLERRQQQLEEDIFDYVYSKYSVREFELFKMYICLKPAVNYGTLSEITSLKPHQIQFIISKIKKDLQCNEHFLQRRNEARA